MPLQRCHALNGSGRLEAEYQALEKTPGGQSVAWASPVGGASGEVKAGTPYQVGQQNCRQYTHSAQINGTAVTGRGAACRNADGSWTPLS
jgi:surface antigen